MTHDLETLSFYDDKPRVLELSMIAVSREHFWSMKDHARINNPFYKKGDPLPLPRVCQKYTALYNPKKTIYPIIEEITGLSNYNLHHLKGFDKESATSIKLFLNLPSPVAFVAHNGNNFDFPILKAELMGVQEGNLESVVCIDSLKFLRHFEKEDIKKLCDIAQKFLNDESLDENNNDLINNDNNYCETLANCQVIKNGVNKHSSLKLEGYEDTPSCSRDSAAVSDNNFRNNSLTPKKLKMNDTLKTSGNLKISLKNIKMDNTKRLENFITQPKIRKEESSTTFSPPPPSFPLRGKNDLSDIAYPPFEPPLKRSEYANNVHNGDGSQDRKALFQFDDPPVLFPDIKIKPQSQSHIYYRIYGKKYLAHKAEADAEALLQICAYHGGDFVTWADNNFIPFRKVDPKWHS